MKKILFGIPTLGEGGAERVLINLVNNLSTEKYDVTVFTIFDDGVYKSKLLPHIKYKSYFKKVFRGNIHFLKLFSPNLLYRLMIKEDYDVIVSYLEGPITRIFSGNRTINTKKINWVHTEIYNRNVITRSYRSLKEAIKSYLKYDYTIFVSETVKESFEKKIISNPKKHVVLYNTVETDEILSKSKEKLDDFVFESGKTNIISVGTFKEKKGFMRLLNIVSKLVDEGYKVNLYLLGKGEQEKKYIEFINERKLQDNVTIIGFKSNPYKYVRNADLFVCSSYSEGYSTAVTESLIVGTPVITTLCSGMEEMLGLDSYYGVITKNDETSLYEGIKGFLDKPEMLEIYKLRAIERGAFFSKENTLSAVEEILDKY